MQARGKFIRELIEEFVFGGGGIFVGGRRGGELSFDVGQRSLLVEVVAIPPGTKFRTRERETFFVKRSF